MKTMMLGLVILGIAGQALAVDQAELDNRVRELTVKLEALQAKPDRSVPPEALRNAQGIVLLDRTKAGFGFAFQTGSGIAMARDPVTKQWSAPAFLRANEASLGVQAGGDHSFSVILLMTTNATRAMADPNYEFGGEVRGTAGEASGGAQGQVSNLQHDALLYDDHAGFFAGFDVKQGGITPDVDANIVYYGKSVTANDILFGHKVEATESGTALAHRVVDYSKTPEVSER